MDVEKIRKANRERQKKYREAHKDEINLYRKERYNNRIINGKCPRCGGKVKKGRILCTDCCEYQAALNRKYAEEKKQSALKSAPAKKTQVKARAGGSQPEAKTSKTKTAAKKPAVKAKSPVKAKPAVRKNTVKNK